MAIKTQTPNDQYIGYQCKCEIDNLLYLYSGVNKVEHVQMRTESLFMVNGKYNKNDELGLWDEIFIINIFAYFDGNSSP
jgi:hypothetical protein